MNKLEWTKWSAAASKQGVLNGELWMLDKYIEFPSLGSGGNLVDAPGLSQEDRVRYENILNAHFRIRENLWFQYQNGALDQAAWAFACVGI